MKATKFTEEQIAFALRQGETGTRVAEVGKWGSVRRRIMCGRRSMVD